MMKSKGWILLILFIIGFSIWRYSNGENEKNRFPVLKGPYLGQKPPSKKAVKFARGILAIDDLGFNTAFSPDGNELFFTYIKRKTEENFQYVIKHSIRENNIWHGPEVAFFSGVYDDADVTFTPDGKRLFFCSDRPHPKSADMDIWYIEKTDSGWSQPIYAGTEVNTIYNEVHAVFTQKGNLFFASNRPGGYGDKDIYMAKLRNGRFTGITNLGPNVNSKCLDSNCYVPPDERYIIFESMKPGGYGEVDLYVSFQAADRDWTKAINLGDSVNTEGYDLAPIVSPDGKYLFFFRTRCGDKNGIYWMDAKIIQELKPKGSK